MTGRLVPCGRLADHRPRSIEEAIGDYRAELEADPSPERAFYVAEQIRHLQAMGARRREAPR